MFDLFVLKPKGFFVLSHYFIKKYSTNIKKYFFKGFFLNLHLQSMTGVIDRELPCGAKSR